MVGDNLDEFRFAIFGRTFFTNHVVRELSRLGFSKPIIIVDPDDQYIRDKRTFKSLGLKETIEWYLKNMFFFNKISKKHFEKRLGLKTW